MFGKLKEKLSGWFKSSKEKVEGDAEVVETEDVEEKKVEEIVKPILEKRGEVSKAVHVEAIEGEKPVKEEKVEEVVKEIPKETPTTVEQAKEEIKETQDKIAEVVKEEVKEEKIVAEDIVKPISEKPSSVGEEEVEREEKKEDVGIKEEEKKEIEEEPEPEKPKGFFEKVRSKFSYKISEDNFNEIFDDLEMLLLENNVALEVVEDIKKSLSEKLVGREIRQQEIEGEIKKELKNALNEILIEPDNPLEFIREKKEKPFVILFFGINGTGKTTSIAKVAYFLKKSGISVVLAAGDTFRAASIEQIAEHAKRLGVPLIKQDYGSDPAAVGFDAIKYAKSHGIDVVLIDTAGRMHTRANLIEEMKKIERVTNPDLKMFVAESIAGNDATEQAKTFHEAIEIDGSLLSKADIDERGGTIISVSHVTNKPIFYLGIGQEYGDLRLFNKQEFIESLGL